MELIKKLNKIQQNLSVPKNQENNFGHYKYRSCEDILEAVKPLLKDDLILTISDEVINLGNKFYVKAKVELRDKNETIGNTAYAREPEVQKGMNEAQITGSTSSYARKYALNGLFCIDDTKDADTFDNTKQTSKPASGAVQNSVNKLNNYQKTDMPWITDELFEDAIKKSVEAKVFKIGTEPKEVMKVLRLKYAVAKKYEAMIEQAINKYAVS